MSEELARDLEDLVYWGREEGRLGEVAQLVCETLKGLKNTQDHDSFLLPLVLKCLDFSYFWTRCSGPGLPPTPS